MITDITTSLETLLQAAQLPYQEITNDFDDTIDVHFVSVNTDDESQFLDKKNDVVRALHTVLRSISQEKGVKIPHFVIDINGKHRKQIDEIKVKAKIIADRVTAFEADMELPPMNAHDRLIVHSYVGKLDNLATESSGESPNRFVVVKYTGQPQFS